MEFRILGPLEVLNEDRSLQLGARQRALLALLLVHVNEPVTTDRIIDALWGESPPAGATKNVQVNISRLRRAMDVDSMVLLSYRASGYELQLDPSCIDASRYRRAITCA